MTTYDDDTGPAPRGSVYGGPAAGASTYGNPEIAFKLALKTRRLVDHPGASRHVWDYMYMGHWSGFDQFKHVDTRAYLPTSILRDPVYTGRRIGTGRDGVMISDPPGDGHDVSPYLLKRLRTYEEVIKDHGRTLEKLLQDCGGQVSATTAIAGAVLLWAGLGLHLILGG